MAFANVGAGVIRVYLDAASNYAAIRETRNGATCAVGRMVITPQALAAFSNDDIVFPPRADA